jgi:hypothetical protein
LADEKKDADTDVSFAVLGSLEMAANQSSSFPILKQKKAQKESINLDANLNLIKKDSGEASERC